MDQDMVRDVQCCDDDHGDGDEGDNDDDGDGEYDDDDDAVILTTMTTAMLITTVRTMKMMTYATLKDKRLPGKKLKIFFWRIAANRIDSLPFAANLLPAGLLRLGWLTVRLEDVFVRAPGRWVCFIFAGDGFLFLKSLIILFNERPNIPGECLNE